ncbi:MAG: GNAT family N-acetyltransferase [Candidatus Dojkabacteria bacterium]|nr:GNAT family N-acetyltransferase [Candidatus Dojkabacteria bacterium]
MVQKPYKSDIRAIRLILNQWTDPEEVGKYIKRIEDEIDGKTKYNMQFFVLKSNSVVCGVGGIADPLPKTLRFSRFKCPGEIKILYMDNQYRGQGLGRTLLEYLENEAQKDGYDELIIRSAERYRDTAYSFYEQMGYESAGQIEGEAEGKKMSVFRKAL